MKENLSLKKYCSNQLLYLFVLFNQWFHRFLPGSWFPRIPAENSNLL